MSVIMYLYILTISPSLRSNYILGYAIIQIPDLLLFLYGLLKKLKRNKTSDAISQSLPSESRRKDTSSSPCPDHHCAREVQQGREGYKNQNKLKRFAGNRTSEAIPQSLPGEFKRIDTSSSPYPDHSYEIEARHGIEGYKNQEEKTHQKHHSTKDK